MATVQNVGSYIASGPGIGAAAVVKSDTTVINPTRALWIGGVGNVVVTMNDGSGPITFTAVPAGTHLDISVTQVLAATTATLIVAIF